MRHRVQCPTSRNATHACLCPVLDDVAKASVTGFRDSAISCIKALDRIRATMPARSYSDGLHDAIMIIDALGTVE